MTTALGQALASLVDDVHDQYEADTARVWRSGRWRRRWALTRSSLLAFLVLGAGALVLWPGLGATPPPQAAPAAPSSVRTYPSVIPDPHFAPLALDAHRPMAATYVDGQALYAVDDRGQSWKAPGAAGWRQCAALSPDGRYATDGWEIYDFTLGTSTSLSGQLLGTDDVRTGATWSPDSRRLAVVTTGSGATVDVGTVSGVLEAAPALPQDPGATTVVLQVSWLDDNTLLVTIPGAPTLKTRPGALGSSRSPGPSDRLPGLRRGCFGFRPARPSSTPRPASAPPPTVRRSYCPPTRTRGDMQVSPSWLGDCRPGQTGPSRQSLSHLRAHWRSTASAGVARTSSSSAVA
jgi:hypothetical protein